MKSLHKEENLGKAYDSKLMKRLITYAKPYWHYLLFCVLLLMLVTVTDLSRPYLLKIAIDDYISGYTEPMYVLHRDENIKDGVLFNNKLYVRQTDLTKEEIEKYTNVEKATIVNNEDNHYLVSGSISDDSGIEILKDNNTYKLLSGEIIYDAIILSDEDYKLFRANDIRNLSKIGLIFLGVIVFGFFFNYLQVYILNYTSQKIVFNIRQEVFSHLQKMSLSYYDKNPVGRLVTRVTNDTETLNDMYTNVLVNLFKDVFLLLGIVFIMLKMNYKLALLSFTVVPLIMLSSIIFRKYVREAYRVVRVKLAKINSTLNENITGIKTIQIFNKELKKYKEFDKINHEYLDATKKQIQVYAIFRPTIEIIRSLGIAIIIWYGGRGVINNVIEFGVLYAFITYLQKFFMPIIDLTDKYNILQSAMASAERIFLILDKDEDIKNIDSPQPLSEINGEIEFKNVWFAYEEDNWVLRDVSFNIKPGEAVAFVGATGAGKSSIINLINRFYDIQKGEILIDGKNIKEINKYELRKHIGIVLQDVFLFTGNIRDNITLNNNLKQDEIEDIAKYVNAHKFISKLPKKYDEPVMERGSTLSSGQRQLLAFGRALAFNPNILVLDEATSNIDTETESLIQDALLKLIKGRTTIAVAHRLSTIQHSDKIIVLHKGKIREMGCHQELLEKGGMYYDLYRLQYKEDFKPSAL